MSKQSAYSLSRIGLAQGNIYLEEVGLVWCPCQVKTKALSHIAGDTDEHDLVVGVGNGVDAGLDLPTTKE